MAAGYQSLNEEALHVTAERVSEVVTRWEHVSLEQTASAWTILGKRIESGELVLPQRERIAIDMVFRSYANHCLASDTSRFIQQLAALPFRITLGAWVPLGRRIADEHLPVSDDEYALVLSRLMRNLKIQERERDEDKAAEIIKHRGGAGLEK